MVRTLQSRVSTSRANIDHIAIAPSGVWVIDSKRYKGRVSVSRPLLGKPQSPSPGATTTASSTDW
jgi:nuclease-like protein